MARTSKPRECRVCGTKLLTGVNWLLSVARQGSRICRDCGCAASAKQYTVNPEKRRASVARYFQSIAGRYVALCSAARVNHGVETDITLEEYASLMAMPCEYCSGPLSPTGVNLDRIDNKRSYLKDNVLPCCTACNFARNVIWTPDAMRLFIGPAIRAAREYQLTQEV